MSEVGVMKKLTIGGSTYTIPEYELPIASANTLGGIKVGTGLNINSTTGVLSATGASFDETDPVFTASAAYGITQNDIDSWDAKVSDTGKWDDVNLNKGVVGESSRNTVYIPVMTTTSGTTAFLMGAVYGGAINGGFIARYDADRYLYSATPSANDNSTKVATTAYVDAAIPDVSGFISTETDPIFIASPAAGITQSDIVSWDAKISDDKTWGGVTFGKGATYNSADQYIPYLESTSSTTSGLLVLTNTPAYGKIPKYDNDACLISTTPTATDNSTKVATTAFVKSAIPTNVSAFTNDSGYLTSYTETDPIFVASAAHGITSSDISNWNSKTDTKVKLTEKTSSDSGVYPLIFGPDSDDIVSGTAYEGGYSDLYWEPNGHVLKSNSGVVIRTGLETQISMQPGSNIVASFNSAGYMSLGAANDNLGRLCFYNNTNSYNSMVSAAGITANRTLAIPDKSGTIALVSDIPTTLPASDVYAWAKASSKPSYTFSEIGSKPTTLSGYGITDANIVNGVITLGNNSITPLTSHQDISGKVDKSGDTMSGNLTFSDDGEGIIFTFGTNTSQLGSVGNDGTVPIIGFNKDTVFRRVAIPRIDNDAANKKYVDDTISGITVPTKTSDLTNDSGFITSYTETDPIFVASAAHGITTTDITNWNYAYNGYSTLQWNNTSKELRASKQGEMVTLFSQTDMAYNSSSNTTGFLTISNLSNYVTHGNTGSSTTGITATTTATKTTLGTATSVTGVQSSTTTASKVTVGSHSTDYGVTAAGSGSASLTFTMDTTDTKKLKITFSHTHTAPTLGSKVPTVSASNVTVPIKDTNTTSIPNVSVASATVTLTDNGHTHTI